MPNDSIFFKMTKYFGNVSMAEYEDQLLDLSNSILEYSNKTNIFLTLIVTAIGLTGNCLTIFVFGQAKYRTNPSHVYLLCLAVNDSLFLIIHFFEGKKNRRLPIRIFPSYIAKYFNNPSVMKSTLIFMKLLISLSLTGSLYS